MITLKVFAWGTGCGGMDCQPQTGSVGGDCLDFKMLGHLATEYSNIPSAPSTLTSRPELGHFY